MNLTSAAQVKSLLREYNLNPKKRLGQNFLIDRNVLNAIIAASGVVPGVNVLEIGPGLGTVTVELARAGARVVCVEADAALEPVLASTTAGLKVRVVIGDFLKIDLFELISPETDKKWTVVSNLPYYITSPILAKLVDAKALFSSMVLMVQREVARRIQAIPGSDDYGSLSVYAQFHCRIESVMKVSHNVFFPVPEVDSEIVKLIPRGVPAAAVRDEELLFRIVRASFSKRRKTLLNALGESAELGWGRDRAKEVLRLAGIDETRRGETLSIEDFARLTNVA